MRGVKKMMIETARLIVRTFREEETEALYRIKTDPQVMEFCPDFLDVDAGPADMQGYIRAFRKIEEDGDTDAWQGSCLSYKRHVADSLYDSLSKSRFPASENVPTLFVLKIPKWLVMAATQKSSSSENFRNVRKPAFTPM